MKRPIRAIHRDAFPDRRKARRWEIHLFVSLAGAGRRVISAPSRSIPVEEYDPEAFGPCRRADVQERTLRDDREAGWIIS